MNEALKTCYRVISKVLSNATSSLGLECGVMPFAGQVGPKTAKSGPAPALANLSPRQAKEAGLLTSGTYGLRCFTSYSNARLQFSLESRLRVKTALSGSTLFKLTYKLRDTPSRRRIFALRASVLRTSDKDSTSWPTPTTRDHKDGSSVGTVPINGLLGGAVWLSHWPTTRQTDGEKNVRTLEGSLREIARKGCPQDLNQAAVLSSWPTPMAGTPAQKGYNEAGNTDSSRRTVALVHGANATGSPASTEKPGPVEPGTFPLAHGIANRVGRLRGYGNALCAPVAQAFIEAYLEVEKELHDSPLF